MGFKWSFERSRSYIYHRKKRLLFTSYTPLQNSELPGIFIQVDGDGNSQQSIFFCFAHAQKLITDQVPDWFVFDVLKRAARVRLVDLLMKQDSKSTWFILLVKRAHGWQLKENHFRFFRMGLLQLAITWYKIHHAGGQAHYYSRTGTLKQRDLNQWSLTCLCFDFPVRE